MTPPVTPVEEAIQAPDLPAIIELFDLDISAIAAGQPTLRFVSGTAVQNVVQRGGVSYMPAPLQLDGFDRGGTGAMAQPTVRAWGMFCHKLGRGSTPARICWALS